MRRPPRDPKESIFDRRTVVWSLLQGLIVLLVSLGVFIVGRNAGLSGQESRAMAFSTLIVANLGLILTNASWSRNILATLRSRNAVMWWIIGGALIFLGIVLYVPFLSRLFRFSMLSAAEVALCLCVGLASVAWFELPKLIMARRGRVLLSACSPDS